MRRFILISFVLGVTLSSNPVRAQDGADIMRGVLGFAVGEIERQQRRDRQERIARQRHQEFITLWHACFRDELAACNEALSYQHLLRTDRTKLETKRRDLLTTQQQKIEHARQADQEQQRAQREQTERRLADQQAEEVRLQRQRELEVQRLAVQRAETERLQRLRAQEERRLADLRAFSENRSACRNHDTGACTTALRSSLASAQDRTELLRWQAEAATYQQNRTACQAGERRACTDALASKALAASDRAALERWHTNAHPFNRALASLDGAFSSMSDLPTSTVITGSLALLLSFALGVIGLRRRVPVDQSAQNNTTPVEPTFDNSAPFADSSKNEPTLDASSASFAEETSSSATPPPLRDTPGALAAMELAEAYIEEVREADRPEFDDKIARRAQLNTLALAAKQLALAENLDPDAEIVLSIDGEEVAFTIGALKAKALILEARSYHDHETKKALPALRQATTVDPSNATAHYLLGMILATNMNRAGAIEALQCAVDLEPGNLTFRKELNRAESISGVEAAAFKATRVGERVYDTGIATANVGIAIWNVFATFMRVISWPFRVIDGLARLLRIG